MPVTILVIEDSRLWRVAIEKMLVKAGHRVIAVGDGQEGLRRAQEDRPDLILLDMMLPGLEGTGVLGQLKQEADYQIDPSDGSVRAVAKEREQAEGGGRRSLHREVNSELERGEMHLS